MTNPPQHPLAPLDGDEITQTRHIVEESGLATIPFEDVRFAYVGLCEPPKDLVRAFERGEARPSSAGCGSSSSWDPQPTWSRPSFR